MAEEASVVFVNQIWDMVLLIFICLNTFRRHFCINTFHIRSSDVTSLFVQRGEDVHLEVTEPVQLNIKMDLFWKFNTTNTIGKLSYNNQPVLFDRYEERAEIFVQNQSLLLKNLQQNDTGNYVALVTGAKDRKVPVSPVDLTVNSSSSDNCNFTVTCRTRGSHSSKTFRCDNRSCSEERGEETTTSINVYVDEGFIICNHSNKVSWKQDRKKVDFVYVSLSKCRSLFSFVHMKNASSVLPSSRSKSALTLKSKIFFPFL
uniref:Immunoglobulin subtype domain-containing protein n=1 Tax=Lates calcarifer TaxID=8187 RepID=A0A4W6BMY1_LATCA